MKSIKMKTKYETMGDIIKGYKEVIDMCKSNNIPVEVYGELSTLLIEWKYNLIDFDDDETFIATEIMKFIKDNCSKICNENENG